MLGEGTRGGEGVVVFFFFFCHTMLLLLLSHVSRDRLCVTP